MKWSVRFISTDQVWLHKTPFIRNKLFCRAEWRTSLKPLYSIYCDSYLLLNCPNAHVFVNDTIFMQILLPFVTKLMLSFIKPHNCTQGGVCVSSMSISCTQMWPRNQRWKMRNLIGRGITGYWSLINKVVCVCSWWAWFVKPHQSHHYRVWSDHPHVILL